MKTPTRLLLALLICASITTIFLYNRARAATPYTWNQTGTASWATAGNWTPARTTPAVDDVLIFNNGATTTVTNIPTQTIGQLSVSGNTTVNLQANAAATVLTIAGDVGTDLSVASGSALNMTGANTMTITLAAAATGSMSGNMTCSTAASKLDAATASAITFNSGAIVTQAAGCTGNLFTAAGTANAIVFASGSTMIQQTGANPFGLAAPSSKVIFQTGSLFSFRQNAAPGFSGRTYADLEFNFATYNQTSAGGGAFVVDNLSVVLGVAHLQLTNVTIKGNISVAAGQTLDFNPAAAAAIGLAGTTPQTVSHSGTLTFNNNANITVSNASGVTLNNAVTWSGANVVNAGATLATAATLTNNGTTTINGTFQLNDSGAAAGTNEFVYGATGSLSYNQSGPAYIVDIVDAAWPFSNGPFNVTVQNGGGVSLNDFRDVNGTLSLLNGSFGNAFNLNMGNGATIVRRAGGAFAGGAPGFDTNVNVIYDGTAPLTTGFEIPTASSILKTLIVTNTGAVTLGASATANAASAIGAGASLNTGAFTFTMSGATLTNSGSMIIMGAFRLNQGGFAAGNDFAYTPAISALVFNNTSGSFAVSGTPVFWPVAGGPANVIVQGSGGITMNVPRAVNGLFQYAAGVSNMANLTLNGVSQVNSGGFTSGSPTYGAASLLKYNTGGTYGRNGEWLPNSIGGAGYPASVQLSNNTTLDLPNSSSTLPFQMSGSLTIDPGSTMQLAGSTPMQAPLRVLGNLVNNGTLNLSSSSGGDLEVRGNWTNSGTFNNNSRTVTLNGASGQTVSGNATFFNLSKTTATAQTLTFAAGSTQTVTNSLSLVGASGNLLSLRSTITGTQWKLNAPATQSVSFVDVKDSDASGGALVNTLSSVDSGNNLNWNFPAVGETDVAVSGGNLVITDINGGATADTITISLNATNVRVTDPSHALTAGAGASQVDAFTVDVPLASISSIQVNTLNGNDVLTLNFSGGNFLPASGLSYAGGNQTSTPGDRLAIVGGTQGTVTYNYTNAHDGSVVMSAYGTVSYTGLEPLSNSGSATDVIFNLPVGPTNTITMEDDGVAANGMSRMRGGTIETTDFANPANSLQIVRGNAADFLTINGPADFTASLALGSAGNEFTQINFQGTLALAANKNLAAFATGPIALLALTPNVSTSGTGTISLTSASNIIVGIASVSVVNGDMTLSANQQASPTAGTFTGLTVEGTLTTTGGGKIILAGKGGANAGNGNHVGILVDAGGVIASTSALPGAGTITLNGTGGTGTTNDTGVFMDGTSGFGTINSVVGDISINGQGTGTTVSNYGVNIQAGAVISSTGTARITIDGTPGNGTNANGGIRLLNTGTQVKSTGGDILLTGHSGATTGNGNRGVGVFQGALVSGSGPAKVKLDGTGSSGTSSNIGVEVAGLGTASTPAIVTSASEIQIIGHAGTGSSPGQIGVNIDSGAKVLATGSANLIVAGTGGTGTSDCYGVGFEGANTSGTTTSAVNGNITITGVAGTNAGNDMDGVRFEDSVAAQAVAINITGTGSLIVNGTAGNTNATSSGINIVDDCTMSLTGATNSFIADTMDFGTANVSINAGSNAFTLRQKTNSRTIVMGGADSATALGLTDAELDLITAATLNFGDANSGAINVSGAISRSAMTTVNPTSGANIDIQAGGSINTLNGNFNPVPATNFFPAQSGVEISTGTATTTLAAAKDLKIVINNASVDSGYTQLNVAGLINLNGANLALSGAHVPTAGQQFMIVNNDGAEAISGTFNGLPEGATIPSFLGSGLNATISYVGGDGNDAVLSAAAAPAQEIAVEEPAGNDLNSGALRDFGNQAVATTSAPKTFTIKNIGTANLNITNITKTGTHAAEFTVSPDLSGAVVTPGNSTTFNVTFTPAALTLRQATIHINSNDADEGSFNIDLQGTGVNADYTITASALAVVVTDLSGNSDTLTVSEPGAGLIKFAAPGRFFSVNGGLATSGDSGNIGIPSVTTITVNQGAGNDIYNMGAFSLTMPSLQINGGTGDDTVNLNGSLTFGATRMLDIDLQDDSATPGIDSVNIATNASIFMTTTGTATIRASRNFTMASGSTLQVENGAMIIETNLQASPTSGDFNGVDVSGGSIFTVGSGNVVINGKGGAGDFIENIGVTVSSGGKIASTNSGTLAVQGTGGAGSGSASAGQGNLGVYVTGSGSTIKSAASATQITGFGGTTNDSNVVGVVADELGTLQTDGAGALTINGTGGTVIGGSPTFVNSAGVFVVVGAVNGDGGLVKSTGTGVNAGNIIITGTATNGGNGSAQGVRVDAPGSVTTVDGHISITGTSAACGNACLGVSIRGDVKATGNANITIDGTGSASSGVFPVHGVNVRSTGNVAAVNGDIAILATGGSSTGTDNAGFDIGTPATGTLQTTGTGRIIVSSDNIRINPAGTNATINAGANIVSLRQRTNSTSIDLGASAVVPAAGTLELSDLELDRVTAGQINIGNSNTGPINVTQPLTRATATNINPTSNANITLATSGSINTGGGSFSPLPGTNFFPSHAGVDVNTGANTTLLAQTLLLNINNTTVDTGYTQLNLVGLVNLNNAALQLGGSHVPVAGQQFIVVNNDSNDPIVGTFSGLPEGAIINNFLVAGMKAKISYAGGDGNDAVLTVQPCPTSFTVNSNLDTVDANPGDNICATAGAVCTLRAAIQEANTGGACGPIDINFSIPSSTITVFSVLAISHSVNINGPVASSITVAGTAPVPTRVFQVSANTTVNISNLTVSGGRATVGAGLLALGPNSTTTLNGMLFTGNIAIDPAGFAGGGGAASGNGGTLNIRNSTFSGNTGTHGGAVSVQGNSPLNLVNVTITANLADGNTGTGPCPIGGSVDGDGGGIQGSTMPAPFLSMRNSIVAFNQDCNANNPNVAGLISDQGNNITVNDPSLNLGPLQNNGGPTFTYGLLAFSTAIDAGNDCVFTNTCVPALGVSLTNDQRGPAFPRQVNGDTVPAAHVDIGAFEKQSPSAANSVISGRIVDSGGTPVEGAAIRLSGAQDRLTVTDKEGNYRFEAVATNALYTVTPSRANFSFRPGDRTFTQLGNHTDALFAANATGAGANPLDTTEYFVRQQYLDFLGREPDEAGLNFWVNNINACGNNALCRSAKREDTSAAFFLSIEFHETGYLVYRAYQTAYGEIPGAPVPVTLAEFQPDAALIEDDLIVNAPGWQAKLEANKQAYFAAFVARPRFASVYADSLTPSEFVDRLFTNRGRMQSAHERDAAIAEFANAADSSDLLARAHALRLVAENRELDQPKLNRAFVLMQYFGYLGRDPDALPDGDFSGYDFWQQKLDEFHGDFRRAEMVKAFLVSGEYRSRFPR
jgi:CSLREA domain-containing protein